MIKRLIWTIWTPMSSVLKKADKLNLSLSLMLLALCAGNSPVPSEFPGQRPVTRSLMFSLICAWINGWANNREAGDLRCHRAHFDVSVMCTKALPESVLIYHKWVPVALSWEWYHICSLNFHSRFDRQLSSTAAEVSAKFESDAIYYFITVADCKWCREWVLHSNRNRL